MDIARLLSQNVAPVTGVVDTTTVPGNLIGRHRNKSRPPYA
ncbi:hypothetical protein ACWDR2_10360 [Streptomyces sp. NPDC003631]|jgi:hypothetical protein